MKKLYICLILPVLCLVFSGCPSKPDCDVIKPWTDKVAVSFAQALDCKGVDAIQQDFIKLCAEKGICNPDQVQGPIADLACPVIVKFVVKFGAGKLPKEWQCTGEPVEDGLTALCKKIPY